jgi:hypothetical protein
MTIASSQEAHFQAVTAQELNLSLSQILLDSGSINGETALLVAKWESSFVGRELKSQLVSMFKNKIALF